MIIHVPSVAEFRKPRSHDEILRETMEMARADTRFASMASDPDLRAYAGDGGLPPPPEPDSPKFSSFTESKRDLLAHITYNVCLWELCTPEVYDNVEPLTLEQKEKATRAAIDYLGELGFGVYLEVMGGCRYLQVNDPESTVDDEEITRRVMETTGVKSSWYVHRLADYLDNFDELRGDNVTPNNVTPNNVTPNNVTPNNVTPNNVTAKNVTPNNVTAKNVTAKNVTSQSRGRKKKDHSCEDCGATFEDRRHKFNHIRRGKCPGKTSA